MNDVLQQIGKLRLVPVAVAETVERAEEIYAGLEDGGLPIAEMTFRTACAAEAIREGRRKHKQMLIGAGTVINGKQCAEAIAAGALFIVGPGFSAEVAAVCREQGVPYLPGCVTPTEIMAAQAAGIDIVKFFPAGVHGGLKAIKALGAAFPKVKFVPTGGVDMSNLGEYAADPRVYAIGGSWILKGGRTEIAQKVKDALLFLKEK